MEEIVREDVAPCTDIPTSSGTVDLTALKGKGVMDSVDVHKLQKRVGKLEVENETKQLMINELRGEVGDLKKTVNRLTEMLTTVQKVMLDKMGINPDVFAPPPAAQSSQPERVHRYIYPQPQSDIERRAAELRRKGRPDLILLRNEDRNESLLILPKCSLLKCRMTGILLGSWEIGAESTAGASAVKGRCSSLRGRTCQKKTWSGTGTGRPCFH